MASKAPTTGLQTERVRSDGTHESFLEYRNFYWLKIALAICGVCLVAYALIDVQPRHNGGSGYGYTLGTIGFGLIIWLTLLGLRKRSTSSKHWSLKGWTSAHVYLGLSLIIIGTLHTGFQLGWNVHTLAYALMMLVIISGIFGISAYSVLPERMSFNRDSATENDMVNNLRSIDEQLHEAAQPLEHRHAALVKESLDQNSFGGGLWRRLRNSYPNCQTRKVQLAIREELGQRPKKGDDPLEKVSLLLERKLATLARTRRHLQLKALLEFWLFVHVPMTFALIAALLAHVISVFFYW